MYCLNSFKRVVAHHKRPLSLTKNILRCLSNGPDKHLPSQAEIVIAGGGVIGTSVAYHLVKLGWEDILLLEQGSAGCGTSWHAAGLVGSVRKSKDETNTSLYALTLYAELEDQVGIGFKKCGSLYLAQSKDRATSLRRVATQASEFGNVVELVSPHEVEKLTPILKNDDLELGLYAPNDGTVNPTDLVQAYLKGATGNGATKYLDGIQVTHIENKGRNVTAINTSAGKVKCNTFINCGGLWAHQLGMKSNPPVPVPLHACEHFYIVTKAMNNVDSMMPVTRDYDARTYIREWSGGLLIGGFEPNAKPCLYNGIPEKFEFQLFEEDWQQFMPLMDGALHRIPSLKDAEIRQFVNGPESFTPDDHPIACRSSEFNNYFVAAGMCSAGIAGSAGIGKIISELVTYGEAENNSFKIQRFHEAVNNKFYLRDKAAGSLSFHYELMYPKIQFNSCRNIMNSALHGMLDQHGAVWENFYGWERPRYFKPHEQAPCKNTFGRPDWLQNVQQEMECCEKNIGIFDISCNSKFNVVSEDNATLLQLLDSVCSHDISKMKNGDVINTVVLNENKSCQGLIELVKVNDHKYCILANRNQHMTLSSWLLEYISKNNMEVVKLEDISGKYASIALLGPHVEELLSELLPPPYSAKDIAIATCKAVDFGYATKVQLIHGFMNSIDGAWQLYIPTEYSQGVYRLLMKYGEKYGIRNAGHFALDSIRIKKKSVNFGAEVGTCTDPQFVSTLYSDEKINADTEVSLIRVRIPTSENWPWGGEHVFHENEIIGSLTSVGYTSADNEVLALGVLNKRLIKDGVVTVKVGCDSYEAFLEN